MGEQRRRCAQAGASSVEYAILVGLIAVVVMAAVSTLGSTLFTDEAEVLGNVLEREEPADDHEPGSGKGLDCDRLPEQAEPPRCD